MTQALNRFLCIGTVLAAVACGGGSSSSTTVAPSDPVAALDQFLSAVNEENLAEMSQLWGTSSGPAVDFLEPEELEMRLGVMQRYLVHESYEIIGGMGTVSEGNQRSYQVRLHRTGCTPVVPFTLVRWGQGWLLQQVDLTQAGHPARVCS